MTELGIIHVAAMFVLGMAAAWLLLPAIIRRGRTWASAREHSFHQTHTENIPRFGGLALAVSFLCVVSAAHAFLQIPPDRLKENLGMVVTALLMFALGFADDLRPLGARKKLLGQSVIALLASIWVTHIQVIQNPLTGDRLELGWWGVLITVFWLVAFTNLINLVDGVDGLAGGISLMLMGLLAYVGMAGAAILPVCVAAGLVGALVAFLRYNFPPAKIYLGDGGAYFLGFLIGLISMRQSQKGTVVAALAAPLLALALPILDVTLAILRRGFKGLPLFRADRKHLHHRLLDEGMSRRETVLLLYGFSSFCLVAAMAAFVAGGRYWPVAFGAVFLLLLLGATRFRFARNWFSPGQLLGESLGMRQETQYALALCRWFELEGRRASSLDALWTDFGFLLGKLGFARVCLKLEGDTRRWQANVQLASESLLQREVTLNHAIHRAVEFVADKNQMTPRLFDQLTELAAEAWLKAVMGLGNGKP